MPAPYSYDLRTKVIKAIDRGMRKTEASCVFQISRNTINLWLRKREELGDYKAEKGYQKGYNAKITDWEKFQLPEDLKEKVEAVREAVNPKWTPADLADQILANYRSNRSGN